MDFNDVVCLLKVQCVKLLGGQPDLLPVFDDPEESLKKRLHYLVTCLLCLQFGFTTFNLPKIINAGFRIKMYSSIKHKKCF